MATAEDIFRAASGETEREPVMDTVISYSPPSSRPPTEKSKTQQIFDAADSARPSFSRDFGQGVKSVGVDLRNLFVEAMTGQKLGGYDAPDTLPGRMGRVSAESAVAALPLGKGASFVKQGPGRIRGFVSGVGESYKRSPIKFVGGEAALGASSGAGGYVTESLYPDSPGARLIGELLGGIAPSLAPTSLVLRGGQALSDKTRGALTPERTLKRVRDRFGRGTQDIEGAGAAMDEDLLPGLTPAAKTGDPGLLAMERSVEDELTDASKFIDKSINEVRDNIRNEIQSFGTVSPEATKETYEAAQKTLLDSLDERIKIAAAAAENKVSNLAQSLTREGANRIFSQELDKALTEARKAESFLYDLIPEKAVVPTQNSKKAFRDLWFDLPRAQKDDMPKVATKFLSETGFGRQTTIKEMRGLQSALRREARNARAGDKANFNKARIADYLANAITDDIANAQGGDAVAETVSTAVNYSRRMNEKFRQGTVGELLGYAAEGGRRVPAGLTLERSIAGSGPKAREAFDDIINAVDNEAVRESLDDFIKNSFKDAVVQDGKINMSRAETFFRNNREILGRMPKTEADLSAAIQAQDVSALRLRQKNRVNFSPNVSKATMFIERGPEAAFRKAIGSRNPSREMKNLVNMAKRDESGEAVEGLKTAFSDYLYQQAKPDSPNFGKFLDLQVNANPATRKAMEALYTPEEMQRWQKIVNTAKRIDAQLAAKPSGEGIMGDTPGRVSFVLARLLGAKSGTTIAQNTGIGGIQAQAIMSNAYADLLKQGMDPAKRLISDAVQDETLFREVLMAPLEKNGEIPEQARRRLNAWIATLMIDDEEEQ